MGNMIEKLKSIGGREWIKNGKHRIYLNDLIRFFDGFEYTTYKTGNINSAKLDGELISNGKATELARSINNLKLYFDVEINEFTFQSDWRWMAREISEDDAKERIIDGIRSRMED